MKKKQETPEEEKLQRTESQLGEERRETLTELGSAMNFSPRGNIYTLTIAGQIEGHQVLPDTVKTTKYEHMMPLLASLEQSDQVEGMLLLLNTVGGDIEAGLGIAELVAGMSKPTVSLVLGGGHSIGVPLAVAPKVSMMAPSASMLLHPVRMSGTVIAAPQTYAYFSRVQDRIVSFVEEHSGISGETFLELMLKTGEMASDVGSVLYGEEAVALGLVDRVGTLQDALACLYDQIREAREGRK